MGQHPGPSIWYQVPLPTYLPTYQQAQGLRSGPVSGARYQVCMDELTSEDFYLDFCIEYNYAEPVNYCSSWMEIYRVLWLSEYFYNYFYNNYNYNYRCDIQDISQPLGSCWILGTNLHPGPNGPMAHGQLPMPQWKMEEKLSKDSTQVTRVTYSSWGISYTNIEWKWTCSTRCSPRGSGCCMWRSSPRTTQVTRVSSRCHLVIILFAVKISDNLTALHYAVSQPGPWARAWAW